MLHFFSPVGKYSKFSIDPNKHLYFCRTFSQYKHYSKLKDWSLSKEWILRADKLVYLYFKALAFGSSPITYIQWFLMYIYMLYPTFIFVKLAIKMQLQLFSSPAW